MNSTNEHNIKGEKTYTYTFVNAYIFILGFFNQKTKVFCELFSKKVSLGCLFEFNFLRKQSLNGPNMKL